MGIAVFVADEQSERPVDLNRWARLAEAVLADEGVTGDTELSVLFVDERSMTDLNRRFAGNDTSTDVLAFPLDDDPVEGGRWPDAGGPGPGWVPPDPSELPRLLGDVVICPEVAWRNSGAEAAAGGPGGPQQAGTPQSSGGPGDRDTAYQDELALLVVHGILHLQGMDHEDEDEATAMRQREQELLERHHRPGRPGTETTPGATPPGGGEEPMSPASPEGP